MAQVELFMRHTKGRSASYKITTSVWVEERGLLRKTLNEHVIRMPVAITHRAMPNIDTPAKKPMAQRCVFCGGDAAEGDHLKCIPEGMRKAEPKRSRLPWRR